jgi:hypothetical protein
LQNHLPFLSNADIYYVIIASEWSVLLDHAVSSLLLWQNKLILGLELKTNEDSWCLMPKLDYKWHYTNYNGALLHETILYCESRYLPNFFKNSVDYLRIIWLQEAFSKQKMFMQQSHLKLKPHF